MARKRMFDNDIINQDSFLELPSEAKALYFLLGMEADDEGFVAPKRVLRLHNINDDNLKILIAKEYLIPFESGVVVITDWRRNNYLDKNKIKSTVYIDEMKMLAFDYEKQRYTLNTDLPTVKPELNQSLTEVNKKFTQYRVEESSIEENSIDKSIIEYVYGQSTDEEVKILEAWETQFEEFYRAYPKKVKKQDVKKWFKKNKPSNELFSSMMNSLEQFRASKDWQKDGGQYIPYPSTWLNQKRWEDEDIGRKQPMSALQRAFNEEVQK